MNIFGLEGVIFSDDGFLESGASLGRYGAVCCHACGAEHKGWTYGHRHGCVLVSRNDNMGNERRGK